MFFLWHCSSMQVFADRWTKQTIYLWLHNSFHRQSIDATPRIMLIDDDSGDGIYVIKKICDDLDIKASFAVIPHHMTQTVADSLKIWQQNGYGIVLHGFKHKSWEHWTEEDIHDDIVKSKLKLAFLGFDTSQIKIIIPPYGCNTKSIRLAISKAGCKMISGAQLMNPDTTLFQMGRIFITKNTDKEKLKRNLEKAKRNNLFVILGTHSSNNDEFSYKLTNEILEYAKELGFEFITRI